jgi:hypothetical protein
MLCSISVKRGAISQSHHTAFNSIPPNYNVSRTGYNEVDLTDNKASNTKIDFSLTKPFANDVEVICVSLGL